MAQKNRRRVEPSRTGPQRVMAPFKRVYELYSNSVDRLRDKLVEIALMPAFDAWMRWYNRRHPPEPKDNSWVERQKRVKALTLEQAKKAFYDMLETATSFTVIEEPSDDPALIVLAPEVRRLLAKYREIRNDFAAVGPVRLSRECLSLDRWIKGGAPKKVRPAK